MVPEGPQRSYKIPECPKGPRRSKVTKKVAMITHEDSKVAKEATKVLLGPSETFWDLLGPSTTFWDLLQPSLTF